MLEKKALVIILAWQSVKVSLILTRLTICKEQSAAWNRIMATSMWCSPSNCGNWQSRSVCCQWKNVLAYDGRRFGMTMCNWPRKLKLGPKACDHTSLAYQGLDLLHECIVRFRHFPSKETECFVIKHSLMRLMLTCDRDVGDGVKGRIDQW